jgi:hypothetical protein
MGSSNQKKRIVTSIDYENVEYGFKSIARIYKCMVCKKLPINPIQCINPDCEKFLCLECHAVPQRCIDCKELVPKTLADPIIIKMMKMIQVRCPQNCGLVDDLNIIASHYSLCDFEDKTPMPAAGITETETDQEVIFLKKKTQRDIPEEPQKLEEFLDTKNDQEKNSEKIKEISASPDEEEEEEDEEKFSNFIRNLVVKGSLNKKGLKNDLMLMKCSKEHFQILPEEQLKTILNSKNITSQNSKSDMVSSLIGFFNIIKLQNEDFKNKIKIEELKESDLEYYLQLRNLPFKGNKNKKIEVLKDYLNKAL